MKTVCVYHSIDLDGWMSAAIVKHWGNTPSNIDKAETPIVFIGYNYGQPIPNLYEYDKVIMCDISFPKELMLELNLRLGTNLVWIDHHQRTINEVNQYIIEHGIPMEGLVTEDGELKAACELTWQYFFPNDTMPEIVRLLGRYDCFGHKGTYEEQEVLEFQYAARTKFTNYNECYNAIANWESPVTNQWTFIIPLKAEGKAIYSFLCTEAKQSYKNGFDIAFPAPVIRTVENNEFITTVPPMFKFICINKERFNPINFGIDYHKDGYDGCACFHYDGKDWCFSLYNDNGLVDCSVIAKQYGGGGHKGASGFRVKDIATIIK